MTLPNSIALQSGQKIPLVGLGTWQAKSEEVKAALEEALKAGYRHIDTAFNYTNEETIGNVLKEWMDAGKIKRNDIFITTKLPHFGNRPSDVPKYLKKSLQRLQLDYVDLYLFHHPFAFFPDSSGEVPAEENGNWVLDKGTDHLAIWKALEEQVDAGKAKGIGLSNFNISQIDRIIKNSRIPPVVLQVELHAYFQQKEIRHYCKEQGITVIAYSPLGSPGAKAHFMKKYNYSPDKFPDVLGTPAIFDFDLSDSEMTQLDALDQGENGRIFDFLCWKGVQDHPEYPFQKISTA
ncbi:Aldo-keto reductase AKR2E4 [Gryllus bimaculatus]|nr:Aldo-keto reductase AKR2E4 [Gryllus bimaculatus]